MFKAYLAAKYLIYLCEKIFIRLDDAYLPF
jgi:hypothetical protein